MRELLFLLLVLACPLAMFFTMRGGHGHGHSHTTSVDGSHVGQLSAEELRRRRGELDGLIEEREQAEALLASEATPVRPTDDRGRPVGAFSAGERERRR